jgi:hypothetical protein
MERGVRSVDELAVVPKTGAEVREEVDHGAGDSSVHERPRQHPANIRLDETDQLGMLRSSGRKDSHVHVYATLVEIGIR